LHKMKPQKNENYPTGTKKMNLNQQWHSFDRIFLLLRLLIISSPLSKIFVRLNVLSDCSFFLSSFFITKKLNDYLSDNFWWCINKINLSQTRMLFWTIIIRITGIVVSRSLLSWSATLELCPMVFDFTVHIMKSIKI
jgi:hypothetical protein